MTNRLRTEAVVMPFDWMNAIHRQAELGDLPNVPIVGYLTRSISALYALHGALLVFLAGDVRRFLPVVRFLAVAGAGAVVPDGQMLASTSTVSDLTVFPFSSLIWLWRSTQTGLADPASVA